jgi:hypothetical protein
LVIENKKIHSFVPSLISVHSIPFIQIKYSAYGLDCEERLGELLGAFLEANQVSQKQTMPILSPGNNRHQEGRD